MADRRLKAVATANEYNQGNIAGLDDAMTRRLIASTVMTESNGGDLAITNKQGYVGRYQAGAGWLAEAGYVDKEKLIAAMKSDGCDPAKVKGAEWKWATQGHMTQFLKDPGNWESGLSLEKYKQSAELQDKAFKINSDAAYKQAIKKGVLDADDGPERIAGFLKARHIAGVGGATAAVTGGRVIKDSNGTSNYDYLHDITRNRDGLDQLMGRDPKRQSHATTDAPDSLPRQHGAAADGVFKQGEKGPEIREMQQQLNKLGYRDAQGHALKADGDFGKHTQEAVEAFQQARGLKVDGIVGAKTLEALRQPEHKPQLTNPAHPDHTLYQQALKAVHLAEEGRQIGPGSHSVNLAAALVVEAKREGITRVDRVELNNDGTLARAVQVNPSRDDPPLNKSTDAISTRQAIAQPVRESSEQLEQVNTNLQARQAAEQQTRSPAFATL